MNLIQFKKYITKRNIILAAFSLLMIIGLICASTFSRYKSLEQLEADAYLENFYAIARLYYIKDGETTRREATINDEGYIELTPKEFQTITVDVEYTGKAKHIVVLSLIVVGFAVPQKLFRTKMAEPLKMIILN